MFQPPITGFAHPHVVEPSDKIHRAAPVQQQPGSRQVSAAAQAALGPSNYGLTRPTWQQAREMRYLHAVQSLGKTLITLTDGQFKEIRHCTTAEIQTLSIRPRMQNILLFIAKRKEGGAKEFRTTHYPRLLEGLRRMVEDVLLSGNGNESELAIARALCKGHFLSNLNESQAGKAFVESLTVGAEYEALLDPHLLDQTLKRALRHDGEETSTLSWLQHKTVGSHIKWTDKTRKFSANFPYANWDPTSYSLRSHLRDITLDSGQIVHLLRMACPVIGKSGTPQIDPLFLGLLESLREDERYLYINNISHNPATDVRRHSVKKVQADLENGRAEVIKRLTSDSRFEDKFFFISLPHDSDFYEQVQTPENMSVVEFIKEFAAHLQHNTQGFYLPDVPNKNKLELVANIKKGFINLWETHFSAKMNLNLEERKEFINMAYAVISEEALKHFDVTHANSTCKDGVDRAMGNMANLIAKVDPHVTPKELVYTLSMPAVTHHARPPQLDRTERSTAAIRRFMQVAAQ